MGGQRAEDERDGAGVGLDEADGRRGERFAGDEVGGAGGGARTAARTDAEESSPAAEKAAVPAAATGAEPEGARPEGPADAGDPADQIDPAGLTDSQILGRRLALARQKAGLSIDEVAAATRIRPGMVREIEAGDLIHCGGDVYARGHVRAIAKCVGVDPEPLIEAHPPVVPAELPTRPRSRIVARPDSSPAGSGAAGGQTAPRSAGAGSSASRPASAGLPTSAARDNAARFAAKAPTRVIRPAGEGATRAIATTAAGQGSGSAPLRPPQPSRKNNPGKIERQPKSANWSAAMLVALLGLVVFAGVQLVGGDSDKHTAAAAPVPPSKPAAVQPPPAPAPPPPPKDVEVRIAAVGADSWLNVTGDDGRVLFDNLLPAGTTQSFKDAKQLGVTLGNASAVHMNLNGKDLGSAGGDGQVVHWTLNPTGAVSG
ncbi:RodZ domain-containing protein [Catenulispora subtropica]|uniref:HTH cro/C1-type domain-containing protein n=1 Tax=Catenulispora subtropica TaxID=450798 RepID=A0ABP5EB20_9ACTN